MNVNLKEVFQPKFFGLFKKGKYNSSKFTSDLIAGIIVGIIALPLAIAFGIASGVTPQQGLITAIVAGFLIHSSEALISSLAVLPEHSSL